MPASVTLVGTLQSELGCPGDWSPDCAATHLTPGSRRRRSATFPVPAGSHEFKVAINDSWDESYGAEGGGNLPLVLAGPRADRLHLRPATHRVGVGPADLGGTEVTAEDRALAGTACARRSPASTSTSSCPTGSPTATRPTTGAGSPATGWRTGFDPTDKGFYHGGDLAA